jgi:hypothetical protein
MMEELADTGNTDYRKNDARTRCGLTLINQTPEGKKENSYPLRCGPTSHAAGVLRGAKTDCADSGWRLRIILMITEPDTFHSAPDFNESRPRVYQ